MENTKKTNIYLIFVFAIVAMLLCVCVCVCVDSVKIYRTFVRSFLFYSFFFLPSLLRLFMLLFIRFILSRFYFCTLPMPYHCTTSNCLRVDTDFNSCSIQTTLNLSYRKVTDETQYTDNILQFRMRPKERMQQWPATNGILLFRQ